MTSECLPDVVEREYLTNVLQRCGTLCDGRVSNVFVKNSKSTVISRIVRLGVSYENATSGAPGSLILKTGLPGRAGAKWNSGSREVAFYTKVVPQMMSAPLVPRCFDAVWDEHTSNWHLLLEDLTDSHFTLASWPIPPSLEQSELIIAVRARFHAAWWDDARLGRSIGTWMESHDPPLRLFADEFARFADRLGDRLPAERRSIYERLIEEGHRLNARYHTHRNMTIIQGDAHVWNVFLPTAGGDDLRLFDWDSWRVDVPTDDLAYMMALHWFPDHRRRHERHLLDRYHAELLMHGVTGYDRSALDDDYRLSVLWQLATPVWQAWNNIPSGIWWPHLERIFMAVDDLRCRDLLFM